MNGRPIHATIILHVDGRRSLGRFHRRTMRWTLELLHGSESELHVIEAIGDAAKRVFHSDDNIADRRAQLAGLEERMSAERAEFDEELAYLQRLREAHGVSGRPR